VNLPFVSGAINSCGRDVLNPFFDEMQAWSNRVAEVREVPEAALVGCRLKLRVRQVSGQLRQAEVHRRLQQGSVRLGSSAAVLHHVVAVDWQQRQRQSAALQCVVQALEVWQLRHQVGMPQHQQVQHRCRLHLWHRLCRPPRSSSSRLLAWWEAQQQWHLGCLMTADSA
jgi:hypothetical protein